MLRRPFHVPVLLLTAAGLWACVHPAPSGTVGAAPGVSAAGLTVSDAGLRELEWSGVTLAFVVDPAGPAPERVAELRFELRSRGRVFAAGIRPADPPEAGSRGSRLAVRVAFPEILRSLEAVQRGALVPYEAVIEARCRGAGGRPMLRRARVTGEFPLPDVPRIRLLSLEGAGTAGVTGRALLEIDNQNAFPVDLDGLELRVTRGGAAWGSIREEAVIPLDPGQVIRRSVPFRGEPPDGRSEPPGEPDRLLGLLRLMTPFGDLSGAHPRDGS